MFTVHKKLYILKPTLNHSEKTLIMFLSKTPEWALATLGITIGVLGKTQHVTTTLLAIGLGVLPILFRGLMFNYYRHGQKYPTHHRITPGTLTYTITVPTELYATFETVRVHSARGSLYTEDINTYYQTVWRYTQTGELDPMPHTIRETLWNTALGGTHVTPHFDMDNDITRPLYFITGQKY